MNKPSLLKSLTLAGALSAAPACGDSHQTCKINSNDPQSYNVIGSPVSEQQCKNDISAACSNFKALVCVVSPDDYTSDLEESRISCEDGSGAINDMCENSDVSLCTATNHPDQVWVECVEE